ANMVASERVDGDQIDVVLRRRGSRCVICPDCGWNKKTAAEESVNLHSVERITSTRLALGRAIVKTGAPSYCQSARPLAAVSGKIARTWEAMPRGVGPTVLARSRVAP